MAKALKVVGTIAGAVATVATVLGNPVVAGIAAVVATVATIGAAALTKPPPARGSVARTSVDPNSPAPYAMGEGYFGGVVRHDVAYGATLNKVPNPYRFMSIVYSHGGPVQSITPYTDFASVSSWYNTFLFTDTQLGATPEADALVPQWSGAPGWTTSHKLSGLAAIGWSFLFDKDGKRFASGLPLLGAYGQWVKVYDPRLDSTQPGGSGAHRLDDETTWAWSENPALHAGTYAYGRYQNGKRVMGVGLPADGIDWVNVMAWANVCDANGWTIFGVLYEPGDRWANLKDICYAGGAEPIATGKLRFKYHAPVVALDTVTEDDLTDDDASVVTMQSYRNRLNTIIPQYISPDHNWELVDAEAVVNSTFLTEDGEEKRQVWPFNFVKDVDQAAQLAAYRLFDTREIAPITLVCHPRLRSYRPGECLHLDIPKLGLDTDAIILTRQIDPTNMKVTLELIGETPAKHAFCLGLTGTPPPTPTIGQTSQQRDEAAAGALETTPFVISAVAGFNVQTDASGVTTTTLPITRSFVATRNAAVVTTDAAWSVESASAGITATIGASSGVLSLDAADAEGTIIVKAIYDGLEYFASPVYVTRNRPLGTSGGGSGATSFSDDTWVNISTTSYVPITDADALMASDASGEIRFSAIASYIGLGAARIKAQTSPDNSTWTDAGSPATGTTTTGGDDGFVSLDVTATGLTPSTDYYIRLVAERTTAGDTLEWIDPFFSATQP